MSTPKRVRLAETFALRVKKLIGGGSVAAFARQTGLKQASVDRYVKAAHAPNAEALIAISTCCGVTTDWLLGLSDFPNGSSSNFTLQNKLLHSEKKLARVNKALGHILQGTKELQSVVGENEA